MYTDSPDHAAHLIKKYLESSTALILDRNSGSRGQVRQYLLDHGMKLANIKTVENFEEAKAALEKQPANIIFCDYELGDHSGFDVLGLQRETVKNIQTTFILFSERNSLSVASQAGELEVDSMLIRPFNAALLKDNLTKVFQLKTTTLDYDQKIQSAKALLNEKKWDEASKILKDAQQLSRENASAYYYEGECFFSQKHFEKAIDIYQKGLSINPAHLKCALGLFDSYFELRNYDKAYEVCVSLYKNHPINPARIPKLITVFVFSHHFEEMIEFSELTSQLDESEIDQRVRTYLSAGLAVCAKYCLLKNDEPKALDFFRKSVVASKGKISVLREIFLDLTRLGKTTELDGLKKILPPAVQTSGDLKILDFECLNLSGSSAQVLQKGLDLLKSGLKSPSLFEIVIRRSIELNRPEGSIDQLMTDACKTYPEKSDFFRGLKVS